jgi:hypothetical protein
MLNPLAATGIAAIASIALTACGEAKIDTEEAEATIRAGITRQTGVEIEAVRCPDNVEAKRGGRFRCIAVAKNGDRGAVQVTQRDDEGTFTWKLVRPRGDF